MTTVRLLSVAVGGSSRELTLIPVMWDADGSVMPLLPVPAGDGCFGRRYQQ
jgi:hypothetical protein